MQTNDIYDPSNQPKMIELDTTKLDPDVALAVADSLYGAFGHPLYPVMRKKWDHKILIVMDEPVSDEKIATWIENILAITNPKQPESMRIIHQWIEM